MAVTEWKQYMCYCERCSYTWAARVEMPKACPACKSVKWNEPKKEAKNV